MSLDSVGTPLHIIAAIERENQARSHDRNYGVHRPFILDVCAERWSAKAASYYSLPHEDGLRAPWSPLNWCNPVYSQQAAWMQRAAREAERYGNTTACLVRAAQDTRYWFRLATSRGTTDFYVGRISFIAPPEGVTLKVKGKPRFIPGGEPIKGTDFASAVVWYGPDFKPGVVRWRDAETGELIDIERARALRAEATC